jgi:hypothetical protein
LSTNKTAGIQDEQEVVEQEQPEQSRLEILTMAKTNFIYKRK